jgi:hypothetical protein
MHILCKPKDIPDIGNETASYKVLPLGNNVYSMDSMLPYLLSPSRLFDHLAQCFPNCAPRLPEEARNYDRGGV